MKAVPNPAVSRATPLFPRDSIEGCGARDYKTNKRQRYNVAMSDRPSELEFKLNNVVLAVNDVVEWLDLGLQLGLPSATLRLIAANPNTRDIKSQRLAMLSEWFKYDTAASWEKLAAALATIGENVVAANVRSRFMKATTPPRRVVDASNQDENTCTSLVFFTNFKALAQLLVCSYYASSLASM